MRVSGGSHVSGILVAGMIAGTAVSVTAELNLDSLASAGTHHALVSVDPENRGSIHGFLHLAVLSTPGMYLRREADMTVDPLPRQGAMHGLVEAMNEYTRIDTRLGRRLSLTSPGLVRAPWLFVPMVQFEASRRELRGLGNYLSRGGFVLADAGTTVGGHFDVVCRRLIDGALDAVGREARFRRLRADHPLYHSYFDFDAPPPPLVGAGLAAEPSGVGRDNVDYMVGVEVGGRLAAVISYQALGTVWESSGPGGDPAGFTDNTRHLQLGINTIVFALTQAGSVTDTAVRDLTGPPTAD